MDRIVIESDQLAEWLRTSFVDDQGQVYLPCGMVGNAMLDLLVLIHDGVPMVCDGGHVYAPAAWLAAQHPRLAGTIRVMVARILESRQTTATELAYVGPRGDVGMAVANATHGAPGGPQANVGDVDKSINPV